MHVKPGFIPVIADWASLSFPARAMPLGEREIVELHCLESVAQCGRIPDGCDTAHYLARGYVLQQGLRYLLTPLGSLCLDHLRERNSEP